MKFLYSKVLKIENLIFKILENIVSIAFFIILCLTIILVFMRYIFGKALMGGGGSELIEFLFIYTTSIGAAVSIGKRDHIKIDFFLNKLNQPIKMLVDSLGQFCVAAINIFITILSFNWISKVGSSPASVLRFPMWIVQIIIPIGCLLVTVFSLFNIVKIIHEGCLEINKNSSHGENI